MSQRITEKNLEALVKIINEEKGMPIEAFSDGRWNIGTYYIDHAYGGVSLCQVINEAGGIADLFGHHMPKRELYNRMVGYLRIKD